MGAILCCLSGPDDGCCPCLTWPFLDNNDLDSAAAAAARQRADPPVQVTVTLAAGSTGSRQGDSVNTFPCPPRPALHDDPQFVRQMERRPLVAGHEKASTQFQKSIQKASGSSLKAKSEVQKIGGTQVDVPSDCEDDCPICLEEYDYENPKMELQCSHGFHLGCIFEWMERSQSCPLCAKVMLFNEDQ